ncbi:MAG: GAF domain-containing sensor histidine kinase [Acidimicrobiales bacterium]|nr:GAF domain-containing sensor histidine kinase [Acidimicrobiales bacterium]HLV90990.1 GAF domain-containing sensor histidine kinase [Acidimicrobiia bacterium]
MLVVAYQPSLERLGMFIASAVAVVGEAELHDLLMRLVSEARSSTGARYAALGVLGDHGQISEFFYEGMDEETARKIGPYPTGRGVLGTVIRENTVIVVDSIADHPDSYGFPPNHPPMSNFLGVPVSVGDVAFGNLYLTEKPGGFDESDITFVTALSRIAGAAVQTSRLQGRLRTMAVIEERNRIARDLHDSVIQDLFAVGLGLQGLGARLGKTPEAEILDDAVDRLDDIVNALRAHVFELRTPTEGLPLSDRLQELVSRMGAVYPTRIRLTIEGMDRRPGLDDDTLLLIASEAMSNALRHSNADNLWVELDLREDTIRLEVGDDGTGFDPSEPSQGMGLANLRSRATDAGGTVHIESEPGKGTRVRVELPRRPQ